jgi:hypothetical protein
LAAQLLSLDQTQKLVHSLLSREKQHTTFGGQRDFRESGKALKKKRKIATAAGAQSVNKNSSTQKHFSLFLSAKPQIGDRNTKSQKKKERNKISQTSKVLGFKKL